MSNEHEGVFTEVDVEAVRAYWNARPCNVRHSTKEVGTREYFDEVEARKYFVEPHIPGFAQFPRWKGKKVLEIGCGLGTDTMNFARSGAQVTAVDLSEESLALARKRAEVMGLQGSIRFYQANAEKLSETVPVEPYDLVYSFGVIHHTPHPGAVLDQIRKYMTAESTLKVMVYNRLSFKVLWIILTYGMGRFWKADDLIARYSEAQTGCPVTYSYSPAQGQAWLEEHGFRVEERFADHIFPYSIPEYKEYRYKKVWYFRFLPRPIFRWLEKLAGWHLCLTARLK
ncbi:MAG: class I SAM-dependent methyltransferase [Vicinamibacteria bacterium]|nr:class I SAM-dependent methyltransferase [Vicinamibacteria bacterium]